MHLASLVHKVIIIVIVIVVVVVVVVIVIEAMTLPCLQLVDQVRKKGSEIFPAVKLKTSRDKKYHLSTQKEIHLSSGSIEMSKSIFSSSFPLALAKFFPQVLIRLSSPKFLGYPAFPKVCC